MQTLTKRLVLSAVAVFVIYEGVQILRSPQADTRRIAREEQLRARTWNGIYDQRDVFGSYRKDW